MGERNAEGMLPGELDQLPMIDQEDAKWLGIVRTSYESSTDFLDDSIRSEWENSLARFHGEHPPGSKYLTKAYRNRSKFFRPKTRSYSRRAESNAAKALFSNTDLIDVQGQNRGDAVQAVSARLNKALLQYRLEHSIPWFLTVMGARQDTFNYGICISLSTWEYEEATELVPVMDPMTGQPMIDEEGNELGEEVRRVVKDRPVIDLIPPENVRFDPNADWRNPIEDSPVVQIMLPMYVHQVREKMENPNPVTGSPEWNDYSIKEILAASQDKSLNEVIRQARVGKYRQDPLDTIEGDEYTMVWVYLNIARDEGEDVAFYTLAKQLMLTDPVPVRELLPLGRESITVGMSVVEAHRPYPIGGNRLVAPLQAEINDIANQRMDNVRLALNKRYLLRRNADVDIAALMRSVPGGGVMTGDPERDVRVLDFPDVTGGSYQEHDRLSQEMDELGGMFSGSSVQANRSLNETVGGMNLLQGDANDVSEYELRTFVETWVEPVLRKLQKLEAMFETDENVMQLAGENSEVFQRYGRDIAIDQLIDQELIVSVNVGMGNTNPQQRLQRFGSIIQAVAGIPEVAMALNAQEVGKEMMAMGGFSQTERFFMSEEEVQQKQQQMQQAQQPPQDNSAQVKAQADMELEKIRSADRRYAVDQERDTKMMVKAAELQVKLKDLYENIGIKKQANQTTRDVTALREGSRAREMNLKRKMGSGI